LKQCLWVEMEKARVYCLPTVVKIRRKGGEVSVGCDVYIGRRLTMGGWKLADSAWRNPYDVKTYGLENAINLYEAYIRKLVAEDQTMLSYLTNMVSAGRPVTLGCWCKKKPTDPCHGDVIVKLAAELISYLQKQ